MKGRIAWITLGTVAGLSVVGLLLQRGVLRFNNPDRSEFPLRGIDVSHHQGEIDWRAVVGDDVRFAYLKATEGGDHKDRRFARNWREAGAAGLARGAYHFFTLCRPGGDQAANFIQAVPRDESALAPVVDLEFVGNCKTRPTRAAFLGELEVFVTRVEEHYQQRLIYYVTYDFLERYLLDTPELRRPLWIRDVFSQPELPAGFEWILWQYCDRGRIDGIDGPVDLNVYRGSALEQGASKVSAQAGREKTTTLW